MPAKTREIKGRMKTVGNIQRITKTMQMIATARFQAIQRSAVATQAYTRKITELVNDVSTAGGSSSNPLLSKSEDRVGPTLLLVITSDRGLCGGYNASVLRAARAEVEADQGAVEIEVAGKKGVGYFKFNRIPITRSYSHFGDKPEYDDVAALVDEYLKIFINSNYSAIKVAYMHFESMSSQTPRIEQILPLSKSQTEDELENQPSDSAQGGEAQVSTAYEFSPSAEDLLDELLPIAAKTKLFQCFNEASVSEQLARMMAMQAATDAAGKMKKSLSRDFNRARQAAITTELSEIIGGAAALE